MVVSSCVHVAFFPLSWWISSVLISLTSATSLLRCDEEKTKCHNCPPCSLSRHATRHSVYCMMRSNEIFIKRLIIRVAEKKVLEKLNRCEKNLRSFVSSLCCSPMVRRDYTISILPNFFSIFLLALHSIIFCNCRNWNTTCSAQIPLLLGKSIHRRGPN